MPLRDRLKRSWVIWDSYMKAKNRLQWVDWWFKDRPLPLPPCLKQRCVLAYRRRFSLEIMIETGTYQGEMVRATRSAFECIYSIEPSGELHRRARQRLGRFPHIRLLLGDSAIVLRDLLPRIERPCLFWLDAHYSGGVTARGSHETQVMAELECIVAHPVIEHVILIDDARCFDGQRDYPSLKAIERYVRERRPEWRFTVAHDIIRITPPR